MRYKSQNRVWRGFRRFCWWLNVVVLSICACLCVASMFIGFYFSLTYRSDEGKVGKDFLSGRTKIFIYDFDLSLAVHYCGFYMYYKPHEFASVLPDNPWPGTFYPRMGLYEHPSYPYHLAPSPYGGTSKQTTLQGQVFQFVNTQWRMFGFEYVHLRLVHFSPNGQTVAGTETVWKAMTFPFPVLLLPWGFWTFCSVRKKIVTRRRVRQGKCPVCGHQLLPVQLYCPECGNQRPTQQSARF